MSGKLYTGLTRSDYEALSLARADRRAVLEYEPGRKFAHQNQVTLRNPDSSTPSEKRIMGRLGLKHEMPARPIPPDHLLHGSDTFEPGEELRAWIFETFIAEDAALSNEDHAHLRDADIGVLWTNCDNARNMRMVIGQAELMPPMAMGKWQRARAVQQMVAWFDDMPDFLITISATAAFGMDDASFCALIEHELYHCAQAKDRYGQPKFTKEGGASYAIKGHDVEEFVGVVARYGASAAGVAAMVEAANQRPAIAAADIAWACGTCLRAAA